MLAEAAQSIAHSDVLAALKQASAATGSDFSYLLSTAMRESNLQPQAKSGNSSASGLFQFVEQTWFGLVKQYGAKHGLASFANAITQAADGRYEADNSSDRRAILALRNDPRIAALMAGEYANATRASLEASLGRNVSNGELYAAHFFGPEAACRLIRMNSAQPQTCAATAFPQAAASNRSVFYHADGTAKSVQEVYNWALKQLQTAVASQPAAAPETAAAAPRNLTVTPQTTPQQAAPIEVAATGDSLTMQLWSAMQPATPSVLPPAAIPQGPFAATPGILDLLGTMAEYHKAAALRTKIE
ncbi:MAG TPA: transglycosylase SLT domain-containing protein [Rhizomicrobium sp.]|nr:transglycosylase SLT domain-containing protein [Rhizomicrobium sp.]